MLRRRLNLTISLPTLESQSEPVTPTGIGYNNYSPRNVYGIRKIRLYKGIFSLVFITIFVTIFYLVFYILIISPTIVSAVQHLLTSQTVSSKIPLEIKLANIISVFAKRENELINQINIGSYYVIISEICIMVGILLYIYVRISYISAVYARRLDTWSEGMSNEIKKTTMKDIVFPTISTIFMIICFQIFFFNFGINYRYMGYYGPNEVIYTFMNSYEQSISV